MHSAPQQEINSLSGSKRQDLSGLAEAVTFSAQAAAEMRRLRFGVFEVDLQSRELRKRGVTVKVQQKPFQVLQRLLETPGEFVSRESLMQHLWPGLHVLFEGSLNTAVNALRRVLGDTTRQPRYIETRAGLGYRFIARVQRVCSTFGGAVSFDAYQDYLKGRYFQNKMTEDDLRKSVAYFEAALAADPDYAPAHAGLADTYCLFAFLGVPRTHEVYQRARESAESALRLDQRLAEAHVALASVNRLCDWNWPAAEVGYRKALELNPNYARGHHLYAACLAAQGRHDESLEQMKQALELEPLSLVISTEAAWNRYMARDFQGAIEQSWKTLAMEPAFAPAQQTLGIAYEQLQMHEEAIVELGNSRTCSNGHPAAVAALGHAFATAGQPAEARESLDDLQRMAPSRFVSPYWVSLVYCGLGEYDLAMECLETAYRDHDPWLVWLKVDPRFDTLRKNSCCGELIKGIFKS